MRGQAAQLGCSPQTFWFLHFHLSGIHSIIELFVRANVDLNLEREERIYKFQICSPIFTHDNWNPIVLNSTTLTISNHEQQTTSIEPQKASLGTLACLIHGRVAHIRDSTGSNLLFIKTLDGIESKGRREKKASRSLARITRRESKQACHLKSILERGFRIANWMKSLTNCSIQNYFPCAQKSNFCFLTKGKLLWLPLSPSSSSSSVSN